MFPVSREKRLVVTGIGCLLISVFGLWLTWRPTPEPERVVYIPTPQPTPRGLVPPSTPTLVPTPVPTPEPTTTPTPEPTPRPVPFSVRQTSEDDWMVMLPAGKWYDTGIPITAETELHIKTDTPFLVKINGRVYFSDRNIWGDWYDAWLGDVTPWTKMLDIKVPADFLETLKLKINDDGGGSYAQLNVSLNLRNSCDQRDSHAQIHDDAYYRAERMLDRIRRKG